MKTAMRTHDSRVALVTGAGQAIALALTERGAQVIATDLTPPDETARKIGSAAYALQLDVTQEEQWRFAAAKAREIGEVDIVVSNAGYSPIAPSTNWVWRRGGRRSRRSGRRSRRT